MTQEEYQQQFDEDDAVGWLAIDAALEKIYPEQKPRHYAPPLPYALGGTDPLDGISVYDRSTPQPHAHFVTYGFSTLYYDDDEAGKDFSKWGFELTFRLAPFAPDDGNPAWVLALLQNLARYVFKSEKWFEEFHLIPANGPIRLETDTDITAVAFVLDPELGRIDTPHGEVAFLQLVGLTTAEYDFLKQQPDQQKTKELLDKLRVNNPLLITELLRRQSAVPR